MESMAAKFSTRTQKMVILQNLVAESCSACFSLP